MPALKKLQTAPDLLVELTTGVAKVRTAYEQLEQRISFIYGAMSSDSDVTKEQIRKILLRHMVTDIDSVRANRD